MTQRSVEFQHGATYTTSGGNQVPVDTDYLYGEEYVYPGPKSGVERTSQIPIGVDKATLGRLYTVSPTKS